MKSQRQSVKDKEGNKILIYVEQEAKVCKGSVEEDIELATVSHTNMNDVPFAVDHDIAIVPVLDLQDVARE